VKIGRWMPDRLFERGENMFFLIHGIFMVKKVLTGGEWIKTV